jgi:hypothetical protein
MSPPVGSDRGLVLIAHKILGMLLQIRAQLVDLSFERSNLRSHLEKSVSRVPIVCHCRRHMNSMIRFLSASLR